MNELKSVDVNATITNLSDDRLVTLICGNSKYNTNQNASMIKSSIDYILKSDRFSELLIQISEWLNDKIFDYHHYHYYLFI